MGCETPHSAPASVYALGHGSITIQKLPILQYRISPMIPQQPPKLTYFATDLFIGDGAVKSLRAFEAHAMGFCYSWLLA